MSDKASRTDDGRTDASKADARETDERVRKRAYALWERDGRPLGHNDEYWARALAEIQAEERASPSRNGG